MKLIAADNNVVNVVNCGEVLQFDCTTYERTKYSKTPDVFAEANRFLAVMHPTTQNTLFKIYKDIHTALTQIRHSGNSNDLPNYLIDKTEELYNLIDITKLAQWTASYVNIEYPSSVLAVVINELNPAKTYIRSDYDELIVLTIAVRFMMPIWGAYNKTIMGIVGKHKEYHSYRLLTKTKVLNHNAVHRLAKFIKSMLDTNIRTSAMIIQGQGTEELPEWILASILVKRLAVADFHGDGGLVKNIFTYVKHLLSDLDLLFGGVRAKHSGDSEEDGEFSQLEKYRSKPVKSAGEIIATEVFVTMLSGNSTVFKADDPIRLAKMIDDTIDPALVTICFNHAVKNPISEIQIWQLTLTQYVVYPILSPIAVASLTELQLANIVMVVAQSLLIHWGFLNLGLLVKASVVKMDVNEARPPITSSRITANTLKVLLELYPYSLKNQANDRQSNVAYKAINELNDLMSSNDWCLNVPPELVQAVNDQGILIEGQVPSNVREMMALLVIRLNELYQNVHLNNKQRRESTT